MLPCTWHPTTTTVHDLLLIPHCVHGVTQAMMTANNRTAMRYRLMLNGDEDDEDVLLDLMNKLSAMNLSLHDFTEAVRRAREQLTRPPSRSQSSVQSRG